MVLIDKVFGKLLSKGSLSSKLYAGDISELQLSVLTHMGGYGVAGELLVIVDVLLVVRDEHFLIFSM